MEYPSAQLNQAKTFDFSWDTTAIDSALLKPTHVERSVASFQQNLTRHVWDAAALEGSTLTLPDVQTLLDGGALAGHRTEDELQALALADANRELARLISAGDFAMNRTVSDDLHFRVA